MPSVISSHSSALALLFAAAACTGGSSEKGESTKTAADSQASAGGMAGMAMPSGKDPAATPGTEITLTAAQIRHGGIAWQAATMGTASASVTVPGQLGPNEDRTARLGAPAPGRVVTVPVRPGDQVVRGRVLVTLHSPEAGAAQSDVAKAQAELASRRAEATYVKSARDRAERLLALKAIPRQDYERAIADDELARSAVTQADAELTRARTSAEQLGADAAASGEIALRAPFAGVVLARTAVPGTVVDAGAPLIIVTDPATLWLTASTPEALAAVFRTGATVRFSVPAYPGETFSARVEPSARVSIPARTLPYGPWWTTEPGDSTGDARHRRRGWWTERLRGTRARRRRADAQGEAGRVHRAAAA
jgi:cobalt-zinc-cadmium efflux system membrane fusion protein